MWGRRAWVAWVVVAVLAIHAVGWWGVLRGGDVGIRGDTPSDAVPGARTVRSVVPGGPADQAGLKAGDVVVAQNGVPATDEAAYQTAAVAPRVGETVVVRVRRALPGGGHGPEEDVPLVAAPILALEGPTGLAGQGVIAGAVLFGVGAAVALRWLASWAARLLFGALALAAAWFGLRAWDVTFPSQVALWHGLAQVVPYVALALLAAAALAAAARGINSRSSSGAAPAPRSG